MHLYSGYKKYLYTLYGKLYLKCTNTFCRNCKSFLVGFIQIMITKRFKRVPILFRRYILPRILLLDKIQCKAFHLVFMSLFRWIYKKNNEKKIHKSFHTVQKIYFLVHTFLLHKIKFLTLYFVSSSLHMKT